MTGAPQLFRHFLQRGHYTVFIAVDTTAGKNVGLLTLTESHALYAEGAFGILPEFYIRPTHRSRGIGKRLLDTAREYALSKGWKRLEVATPPVPVFDRTLKFYEANGYTSTGGRKLKIVL